MSSSSSSQRPYGSLVGFRVQGLFRVLGFRGLRFRVYLGFGV